MRNQQSIEIYAKKIKNMVFFKLEGFCQARVQQQAGKADNCKGKKTPRSANKYVNDIDKITI